MTEVNKEEQKGEQNNEQNEDQQLLSPEARYAYSNLCLLIMKKLYPYDLEWCKSMVYCLSQHLDLADSVNEVLLALLNNDEIFGEEENFINILRQEEILKDNFILIPQDLITMTLQDGYYDARARVLIKQLAWIFSVPWYYMEFFEESVIERIKEYIESAEDKKKRLRKKVSEQRRKMWIMGLASVGGGLAIAFTGGVAAPLIAAGTGAILGSASAKVVSTNFGLSLMTSLFGTAGSSLIDYKMDRKSGDLRQFEFEMLTVGRQPHLTIAISGWLFNATRDDFHKPWSTLYNSKEQYVLEWEGEWLAKLGLSIQQLMSSTLVSDASSLGVLKQSALAGLSPVITLPTSVLNAGSIIEKPWNACNNRAIQAGKQLAQVLLTRRAGKRPITLIGFSLGTIVISSCVEELIGKKDNKGLVENLILFGSPITKDSAEWDQILQIVAGKVINGYYPDDLILQVVSGKAKSKAAGLSPIEATKARILNVNLSQYVSSHLDYVTKMETVLEVVGVRTIKLYQEDRAKIEESIRALQASSNMQLAVKKAVENAMKEDTKESTGDAGGNKQSEATDAAVECTTGSNQNIAENVQEDTSEIKDVNQETAKDIVETTSDTKDVSHFSDDHLVERKEQVGKDNKKEESKN